MDKPKIDSKTQKTEERIVDTSAEHVKELEDELLKLRIEDAFLKELRRLRLEDEAKNERTALVINSIPGEFKLIDLTSYADMPKATYMYWQKRFIKDYNEQRIKEKLRWMSPVQYRFYPLAA